MSYLPKFRKHKFIFDFLQYRKVYPFYDHVLNTTNDRVFRDDLPNKPRGADNFIHIVNYIPPFLQPQMGENSGQLIKVIKIPRSKGFMVNLKGFASMEQFLTTQLSSKRRKNLRSYVRKLEKCFNIRYKIYFGDISKSQYDLLLAKTRLFLQNRFQQKGEIHELLASWDFIEKSTYPLILSKKASLFVIYNHEEPISICLNYHHDNIFHNAIGSYDIAYSKFSLGYIDIFRQLEWCMANGILLFDLSLGDMDYKRIWSNVTYDFEHHIIHNRKKHIDKLAVKGLVTFYRLKESLKKMKIDTLYHKFRGLISKQRPENNYTEPLYEMHEINTEALTAEVSKIDLGHESYARIRKPVIDFQYSFEEKSEDILIYQLNDYEDRYYLVGRNTRQQLIMR